jgi:hypothetical protein
MRVCFFAAGGSNSSQPNREADSPPKSTNVGAIAGGVVGGVLGVALIGGGIYYLMRKKRQERCEDERDGRHHREMNGSWPVIELLTKEKPAEAPTSPEQRHELYTKERPAEVPTSPQQRHELEASYLR